MLGKLMKHEWMSVWKVPTLLIGVLLVVSLLCGSAYGLPIWYSDWPGVPLSAISLFLLYYMAIIVCSVGITVYMAVRFYKSMFTDEGYLTHTLPVTSHQLLLSKVITMSIWSLIGMIAVVISVFILLGFVYIFLIDNFNNLGYELRRLMHELAQLEELKGFWELMFTAFLMFIASTFGGTMIVVGAISIGQMLRKHRILGAIGAYFGITIVVNITSTIVMFPVRFGFAMTADLSDVLSVYNIIYLVMSLVYVAVGIGLYFLSEYLIRRQLDLE
ncbi:MAG: hypothetical protein HDR20_15930 [Lachnospiraceae bacterium]|nr:hypothetical protein [Lachnospiraceae bacterium]